MLSSTSFFIQAGRSADPKLSIADLIEAINQLEEKRQVVEKKTPVVHKQYTNVPQSVSHGAWKPKPVTKTGKKKIIIES